MTLRFDDFVVGEEMGRHVLTLGSDLMDSWMRVFPEEGQSPRAPPGMIAMVTMRAFAAVVSPRPPGNVHGSQRFEVKRLPKAGDVLTTRLICIGKELKRERRWVYFASETAGADQDLCFSGRMAIAWAA